MTEHVKLLGQKLIVTTTHLLGWPMSRTLRTSNAGEDLEQQKLSSIAGSNGRWYSYSGKQFSNFLQN